MAETVIDIHGLTKQYAHTEYPALDGLTITVNTGEVYGFLGPNGAGKSTAIRLLMNFIKPTSGTATILGKDIVTDSVAIKKDIGYLSGDVPMYRKMNGQQFLTYMQDLQPATSRSYVTELTKRLKADVKKPLSELSRGNKQKIGLIQAFMYQPKVLILDEPTSGLDPLMQEVFYELIAEAKQRDSTVFASSHILSEVQKICDRVGIIRDGMLVTEKTIQDLAHEAAQTFDIVFANDVPVAGLKRLKDVKVMSRKGQLITIHVHGKLAPLFALLANYDVTKIDAKNLDLEDVFMRFYTEQEKRT